MPLRKNNSRTFHRCLYGGQLEKITLLKRNDDQQEGTVRAITIFQARRNDISKTGQPIQGDMDVGQRTRWLIPSVELRRVGVQYINVLDRIVDKQNRFWQPETHDYIMVKTFENYVTIDCQRIDPPNDLATTTI